VPSIQLSAFTVHYDQQGSGEPLILIPFLTADHACYAFQIAEYAKHFACFSIDLRGAGESGTTSGPCSTEAFADDVAAFMDKMGIARAHISGLSLGAATGMWLASKYPQKVQSLSLHSGWTKTDAYVRTVVEGWQLMAKALGSVPELVVRCIFPWCLTPDLYASKPEYVQALADFVRSRPAQSLDVFFEHSNAVIAHDAEAQLGKIQAPTLITFGSRDTVTSTRFAGPLKTGIRNSEIVIFDDCSHAPIYERVEEFNGRTLEFLKRQAGRTASADASR
jgi:pimeloyl-ACP methyl ester carboxylesterase